MTLHTLTVNGKHIRSLINTFLIIHTYTSVQIVNNILLLHICAAILPIFVLTIFVARTAVTQSQSNINTRIISRYTLGKYAVTQDVCYTLADNHNVYLDPLDAAFCLSAAALACAFAACSQVWMVAPSFAKHQREMSL